MYPKMSHRAPRLIVCHANELLKIEICSRIECKTEMCDAKLGHVYRK